MSKSIRLRLLLSITATVCIVAIIVRASLDARGAYNTNRQGSTTVLKDPCWFMNLTDKTIPYEVIAKRQDREMHGYPTEIPLGEAIRIFDEETRCNPTLAPYPPLTEDELVAAIVAGPGYGAWGDVWSAQKGILYKIAKDKMMPKGSLLVAAGGPNVQESPLKPHGDIKAKGISIAIFLGLENHEYGQDLKREQIFEIRRTYFSVETVK